MTKIRNEELLKLFGLHVRELRINRNLTQEELADKAGVETRQIGRIERGEVNCTLSTIYSLCKALEIEMKEILNIKFNQ